MVRSTTDTLTGIMEATDPKVVASRHTDTNDPGDGRPARPRGGDQAAQGAEEAQRRLREETVARKSIGYRLGATIGNEGGGPPAWSIA